MATLTGTTIQSTYDSLLKVSDNDAITSTLKRITDGLGNNTPLYLSSSAVEISSGLNVIGSLTASNVSGSNTGDETKASIETKLGAASASNSGYLTSSDWSTFNNKIAGTGTLNRISKFSSTGSIADSNISDNGTLVSISTATTITGDLTATNIIRSGGTSSQFLKADGSIDSTSYQPLLTNPVTGTGTTNTLPKFTGASAIGNSNITDTGTIVTISGNANIAGSGGLGIAQTSLAGYNIRVSRQITGATTAHSVAVDGFVDSAVTTQANGFFANIPVTGAFTLPSLAYFRASGSVTTGGATITNQFGFTAGGGLVNATNNYAFHSSLAAGTGRWNLYMEGTANNYLAGSLGIGTTTLTGHNLRVEKNITGTTVAYGIFNAGTVQSDVTGSANYYISVPATQATSFTLPILRHYQTDQGTFGAGSTVTTQVGFNANSSLIGATNNYGFRGQIPAGANRFNLFMDGTANNHMTGALGIGTQTLTGINLNIARSLTGAANSFSTTNQGSVLSDVTRAYYYDTFAGVQNTAFTLTELVHYNARGTGAFGLATVTEQAGYAVRASLVGATNNFGFLGQIPAGTGRWNLYMSGTANNYLAGNLSIGTTAAATRLDVSGPHVASIGLLRLNSDLGSISAQTFYINSVYKAAIYAGTDNHFYIWGRDGDTIFNTGSTITERMRLNSAGNLIVGSASDNGTGARLQVNGGITYTNIFNRRANNYTLVLTDQNDIVEMNIDITANTVTVPTNASVAFPIGTEIMIMQYGSGRTEIVPSAGVTIRSRSSFRKIADQYTGATLVKVGTDEWYLVGNLTA